MTIATQTTGRQWLVASQSLADTMYVVVRTELGYSRDCPDFYHRRIERGETCKHIDAVKAQQLQPSKVSAETRSWALGVLTGGWQS